MVKVLKGIPPDWAYRSGLEHGYDHSCGSHGGAYGCYNYGYGYGYGSGSGDGGYGDGSGSGYGYGYGSGDGSGNGAY